MARKSEYLVVQPQQSDSSDEEELERLYYRDLARYHEQQVTAMKRPDKAIEAKIGKLKEIISKLA